MSPCKGWQWCFAVVLAHPDFLRGRVATPPLGMSQYLSNLFASEQNGCLALVDLASNTRKAIVGLATCDRAGGPRYEPVELKSCRGSFSERNEGAPFCVQFHRPAFVFGAKAVRAPRGLRRTSSHSRSRRGTENNKMASRVMCTIGPECETMGRAS